MNPVHVLALALLPVPAAVGQCGFSTAAVSSLGAGCNPVVGGTNAPLAVTVSIPTCTVGIAMPLLSGVDKQPLARVLVLGLQNAAQPVPIFGQGCVLFPSPDVLLYDPWWAPANQLPLPAAPLPPTSLYVQGAVLYQILSTSGLELAFSDGTRVDLQ